jgi:hypothetical protein
MDDLSGTASPVVRLRTAKNYTAKELVFAMRLADALLIEVRSGFDAGAGKGIPFSRTISTPGRKQRCDWRSGIPRLDPWCERMFW